MEDKIIGFKINSKGYGTIPKMVMQDRNISIGAKGLYSYFCSYTGGGDTCFPSRKKVCFDLCISIDTFGKYLKQLVENGYIKVEQIKENGRFSHNVYILCDTILPCPKISDTEISVYEKTDPNNNSTNINSINNINSISKEKSIKEKDDSVEQSSPLPPPTKKIKRNHKEKNQPKHKHGEYENVLLTEEEFEKLKKEFPKDYQERIERLSEYIASVGKSYKNHLATIRSWARKDKQQQSSRSPMGLQKAYTEEDYSEGWD